MTDWTLVSRRKGARFYRPVAGVPEGLGWHDARDAASRLIDAVPLLDGELVWYVPRRSYWPEDADNILEDNGRRVPIRWDAAPQLTLPA